MSDKISILKNLILNHPTLPVEDKEELAIRAESLSEEQVELILPLVEEAPENLEKINKYYKDRKEVLATNAPQKIEAFLVENYRKLWEEAQQGE